MSPELETMHASLRIVVVFQPVGGARERRSRAGSETDRLLRGGTSGQGDRKREGITPGLSSPTEGFAEKLTWVPQRKDQFASDVYPIHRS
jgi:hypothetical protein